MENVDGAVFMSYSTQVLSPCHIRSQEHDGIFEHQKIAVRKGLAANSKKEVGNPTQAGPIQTIAPAMMIEKEKSLVGSINTAQAPRRKMTAATTPRITL